MKDVEWGYNLQGADWPLQRPVRRREANIVGQHDDESDCIIKQSPINFRSKDVLPGNSTQNVELEYNPHLRKYKLFNNGHSIQVEPVDDDFIGQILLDNHIYQAVQFHFHAPSEHTFTEETPTAVAPADNDPNQLHTWIENALHYDGKYYNRGSLEMHIVHKPKDKNIGGAVVLAIIFTPSNSPNAFLTSLLANIGSPPNSAHTELGPVNMVDLNIRDSLIAVSGDEVYRYAGSLTTPPLSQNIKWVVFKKNVPASNEQLSIMHRALSQLSGSGKGNYRMVQNSPYTLSNNSQVYSVCANHSRTTTRE